LKLYLFPTSAWIIGPHRQAGRPFRIAHVQQGQFDAEPHLPRGVGLRRARIRTQSKISIDRPNISASTDEQDVFGPQQQAAIEYMNIPIQSTAVAKPSSF